MTSIASAKESPTISQKTSGQLEKTGPSDSSQLPPLKELKEQDTSHVIGTSFEAPAGSLLDVDIEELMQRLHEAQLQDSAESSEKSSRYVPPDYSMQMHVDSQTYQRSVALHKTREQRRLEKGFPRLTSKRKKLQHGFDPVQVIRKHAIHLPKKSDLYRPTLDNAILPLFRWENFHDCASSVYEQLKPALRLSSLFLTHRASSTFWHTLAYGERLPCEETSKKHGRDCFRIAKDVPWDEDKADYLLKYYDTLSGQIHFHFDSLEDPTITPSYTYGICAIIKGYQSALLTSSGTQKTRVCLHTDFYTTAKRLSILDKRNVDPAMALRFNFFLAVNLTHEIAHFFELAHNFPMRMGEVFLNDNSWAESGCAFERKVFGGRIHPVSARIDCAYGLAIYDWPLHDEEDVKGDIQWTIPMEYIAQIQQASTWENADTSDPAVFHIPRNGARSISLCALDMTMWDDEAKTQIADEALKNVNTPLRRLLNGNIVKSSVIGDPLRRTMTGRVVKSAFKRGSGGIHTSEEAKKKAARGIGITRRFRLPVRRGVLKKPLPRETLAPRKRRKGNKAVTNEEIREAPSIAGGNRYSALEAMPSE